MSGNAPNQAHETAVTAVTAVTRAPCVLHHTDVRHEAIPANANSVNAVPRARALARPRRASPVGRAGGADQPSLRSER
eukprot:1946950-Prymnesium_polylepis.1